MQTTEGCISVNYSREQIRESYVNYRFRLGWQPPLGHGYFDNRNRARPWRVITRVAWNLQTEE